MKLEARNENYMFGDVRIGGDTGRLREILGDPDITSASE